MKYSSFITWLVTLVVTFSSIVLKADANEAAQKKKISFKELSARIGRFCVDTRAYKGRLVIVNAQDVVDVDTVKQSTAKFMKDAKIRIEHETGNFNLTSAKRIGEATVYVINDQTLPCMMVAADDRWGFVNVAKFKTEKDMFFKARVRKEIVRVAGFVLGAGDSSLYPYCLTGHIPNTEYLDQIPNEQLPVDVMQRLNKSMKDIGIGPYRQVPYKQACTEGWAPAPTNDVQKKIWDNVYQSPKNPMKIEFDPKKGR